MIDEIYDAYIDCNQQITTDTRNIIKNDLFFAFFHALERGSGA